MREKLGFKYPSVTADSGYESEEGCEFLKENQQIPYYKTPNLREMEETPF